MAHCLIIGMTESGKTTLAKRLVQEYRQRGVKSIVLDPLSDPSWNADFVTDDPARFRNVVFSSRHCAVFIDEAGDAIGHHEREMFPVATKGRHWGHNVHFLSQRGMQIHPTVRDQCGHLFLFACSMKDAKQFSDEWNKPILAKEVPFLKKGNYFHVTRFGTCEKLALW